MLENGYTFVVYKETEELRPMPPHLRISPQNYYFFVTLKQILLQRGFILFKKNLPMRVWCLVISVDMKHLNIGRHQGLGKVKLRNTIHEYTITRLSLRL